ncbi:MAG TPA: 3-ketoacyl-ACP reductase [Pyrinomonadaceae bacterium]|nr:3-ketoacyl-ACP reductase [Pyrinomonadaceae bacterium]
MAEPSTSETSDRRVALVTGGSRGIGRAIAIELSRVNYDVMINYATNETAADETAAAVVDASSDPQIHVETCRANIADPLERDLLVAETRARFGRLDLLVNNAGVAPSRRVDLLEATIESFDEVVGANLKGPYFLTQAVARWMIEQRSSGVLTNYSPAIVNITSVSAYAASPERGEYCISKAGLSMMTKLYAARLAEEGIRVYEIRPGVISTDMTAGVKEKYDRLIAGDLTPIKRWGTAEDVGRAVAAIATDLLPFSTGEVINVDGGFHLRRL